MRKGFEGSHQAGRDSQSDQAATNGQCADIVTAGKDGRAGGGDQEQRGFDSAWAKAVEQDAEGQLGRAEGNEIGACQKTEVGRVE